MKSFLRFSVFIFFIFCFFVFFQKNVHAQMIGPWYDQSFPQWFVKVYEDSNPQEIFGERYTAAQVQWIFYSLVQLIPLPKRVIACTMTADFSGCINELRRIFFPMSDATPLNERSIAERINSTAEVLALATFQDRPISGIGQIKNSVAKLTATDVYAQSTEGTGFRALSSVRSLWSAARNVTYVLMVLVIITFSFLIMFRMKVSPQAVITVQSSLLTIFITLILITFSYAIAGFAIDLMYLVIALISVIFTQTGIFVADRPAITIYQVLTEGPGSLGLLGFFLGYLSTFSTVLFYIIQSPEESITSIISNLVGPLVAAPLSAIVSLIIGISLVLIFLKLLWILIKTFVNILILVIISPFQILFGSIGGGVTGGFKGWLTKLFQNLAVYPTVGVLFLMSYIFLSGAFFVDAEFLGSFNQAINNLISERGFMISNFGFGVNRELFSSGREANWSPPFTFGGQNLSLLWLFASYACISMTPKVVELVQSLFSGKQFPYETAIGQAVTAGGIGAAYGLARREAGNMARGQISTAIGTTTSYLQQQAAMRSGSRSQTTGGTPSTPRPNASQTAQANQVNSGSAGSGKSS